MRFGKHLARKWRSSAGWPGKVAIALTLAGLLHADQPAQPIAVRQTEGLVHGFLILRTEDGAIIADGELTQAPRGNQVTSRLTFHFKDGSLQDETTIYSQSGHFRLVSDHLVQKGPVFKRPMDVTINGRTGMVTVRYSDDGKEKVVTEHLDLPPNVANGMVPIVLKNMAAGAQSTSASMVVATPKPMLVKLAISAADEDSFTAGGASHKAMRYVVKVEIGGVKGVLAPLVGKQPADTFVWILRGIAPTFVKSQGQSFEGGPIWQTELVSPVWPRETTGTADRKK